MGKLIGIVDRFRNQLSLSERITSQLVGNDLPGFVFVSTYQLLEKALRSSTISPGPQEYINHFAILIHGSPQAVLLAIDQNGPARRAKWRQPTTRGHINGLSRVDILTDCVDRTCRPVEVSIY
jgi:hypothetical protein